MTTENLALMRAIGAKMDYITQRQRVLSQNIANSDTPGYRPHDLEDADFSSVLKGVTGGKNSVSMVTTNEGHMPSPNSVSKGKVREQKDVYEITPTGNAVVMEEQMIKAGQNTMDYNTMTSLYMKNIGMIRSALGR